MMAGKIGGVNLHTHTVSAPIAISVTDHQTTWYWGNKSIIQADFPDGRGVIQVWAKHPTEGLYVVLLPE